MKKRIISAAIALIVLAASLTSCLVEKIEDTTPTPTTPTPTTPAPTTPAPTTPAPTTPAPTTPAPTTPAPTTPAPTTPAPTTPAPTTPAPTTPAPTTPAPTTPAPTTPAPTTPAPTTPAPTTPAPTTPAPTTPAPTTPAPTTPAPVEPDPPVEPDLTDYFKNPMTGIESTRDYLELRPIALVISNQKSVIGHQYGISTADVIYEFLAEGGVTRLLMLTYDYENVSQFGPIRSARDYALEIAMLHDAIVVHAGGSASAYEVISQKALDTIDGINNGGALEYFYRANSTLDSYNTYMTSGSKLVSAVLHVRGMYTNAPIRNVSSPAATSYFKFAESGVFTDATGTAKTITIEYLISFLGTSNNVTKLTFNPITGKYLKFIDDVAQTDAANGAQLAFDNVLILKATTTRLSSSTIDIDLTQGGSGYYCNNGKYLTIQWSFNTETNQIVLKTTAGDILEMATGKTFVSIISGSNTGINSNVDFE